MNNAHSEPRIANNAVAARAPAATFPSAWLLPRRLHLDWSYPAFEKRDLRLDILRGFAVFVMVVNHFGGSSWFYLLTGGNNFFVSGAEAFIFISGLVVGMVYGGMALKQGLWAAQVKVLKRALTLYKLNVVLTLVFAIGSVYFGLAWAKEIHLDDPLVFLLDVVTLRQTLYLVDIPLMYTLLMVASAGALWLLHKGHSKLLLAASTVLWFLFQLNPAGMSLPWHVEGNTIFNFAAWQLLFFWAMAIGYHRDALAARLSQMPRLPYFMFAGLLLVMLIEFYGKQATLIGELVPGIEVQNVLAELFGKSTLAPGRLVASFIVFQFAYLAVTLFWKPLWAALGWFLLPLGQNALYAYTMHVLIVGGFQVMLPHLSVNIQAMGTFNTSLQLLALLAIWVMIQRRFLFRFVPR